MMYDPDPSTVATTNLDAYGKNLRNIASFIGPSVKLMAVVNANAYGHGMLACAETAVGAGASMLGVCFASEGIYLRKNRIAAPILVLGPESEDAVESMIEHDLIVSVYSFHLLEAIQRARPAAEKPCRVHIKVDAGMGRIGVRPEQAPGLVEAAMNADNVSVEGIFTHFPSADEDRDDYSRGQIRVFRELLDRLESSGMRPPIAHMCNSAATIKFPEAHFDLVRPGIMTFGLEPYPGYEDKIDLEPVLSWTSRIAFVKDVPAGFRVSYGGTFTTAGPSRLATVPVGYAHGYRRFLSNRGAAIVKGVPVPVVGRVCMDQTVFDVTGAGGVREGDPVILIGRQGEAAVRVEDHAAIGGTISHEIVTGITGRVSRSFVKTA